MGRKVLSYPLNQAGKSSKKVYWNDAQEPKYQAMTPYLHAPVEGNGMELNLLL